MIEQGKQVSIFYTLTSGEEEIESNKGGQPLTYEHGSNQILPALEAALEGLAPGDSKDVTLSAADAYGEINPGAIQEIPLEQLPEGSRQVGAMLQSPDYPGPIRVTEVREEIAILDFNHPLAGRELSFAVEVSAVE